MSLPPDIEINIDRLSLPEGAAVDRHRILDALRRELEVLASRAASTVHPERDTRWSIAGASLKSSIEDTPEDLGRSLARTIWNQYQTASGVHAAPQPEIDRQPSNSTQEPRE